MILFYQVNNKESPKLSFHEIFYLLRVDITPQAFTDCNKKMVSLSGSWFFRYYPNAPLEYQVIVLSHGDDNNTW